MNLQSNFIRFAVAFASTAAAGVLFLAAQATDTSAPRDQAGVQAQQAEPAPQATVGEEIGWQ
ncbi:hypothetical protein [Streptomyces sp. NPDC096339]|uniref:hypothetical protein n=1 Tax=Streptomyces sp. NPDC096339 TaxID=3366086 RepID=UPI0038104871